MNKIITLTSDFSAADPHVGILKGMILSHTSDVTIVDIAHGVYAQDVFQAAFIIKCTYSHYPPGTIHMANVDPGVGSKRKALAMKCGKYFYVGPDNGLFSYPILECEMEECVQLNVERPSRLHGQTFDARDVFAPTAAKIACGVPLSELGEATTDPIVLDIPKPKVEEANVVKGQVIYIDHFGNAVTNITVSDIEKIEGKKVAFVMGLSLGEVKTSYAQAGLREILALIDSMDHLQVAVNHGNAARALNLSVGSPIEVHPAPQKTETEDETLY